MEDRSAEAGPAPRDPDDTSRGRDAGWVAAALAGDQRAFGGLYDAWFDRVYNVSLRIVRDPEVAAEVAQDVFLSAWKNLASLENADAFGGWLLRIARNASFNRHVREQRSRPVDDRGLAVIESAGTSPSSAPAGFGVEERLGRLDDPTRLVEDGELVSLVRDTAAALGERDAEVLDLQLRYGLTPAEIGEVMGMNRNAANQLVHRVKARFTTALQARVLWKGERPACAALDAVLRSAGVDHFDAEAVRVADQHAKGCDECRDRRGLRLQPNALFAAVPILVAPIVFKQQAAAALEAEGVPMGGSAFASSTFSMAPDPGDAGGPDGGSGTGGDAVAPHDHASSRHRGRRLALMGAVAIVVLLALLAVLAAEVHDGTTDDLATAAAPSTTPSTTPPGSFAVDPVPATSEPVTESTDVTVTDATDPVPADGSPVSEVPPVGTPPAASQPTVRFLLTPGSQKAGFVLSASSPRLTWAVVGGADLVVSVQGPAGETGMTLPSAQRSGAGSVCPGQVFVDPANSARTCLAAPGQYVYTLTVTDGAGHQVLQRQATLTLT